MAIKSTKFFNIQTKYTFVQVSLLETLGKKLFFATLSTNSLQTKKLSANSEFSKLGISKLLFIDARTLILQKN